MSQSAIADVWCEWLFQQEAQADELLLFVYGYLIPQVTLAELEYQDEMGEFYPWFCQQVRQCAEKDALNADDLAALNGILTQLAEIK